MKLKNLIAPLQQNIKKTLSLRRFNPLSDRGRKAIASMLLNRGRRKLENLEIPQRKPTSVSEGGNVLEDTYHYTFEPLPNPYPQYDKCYCNNPLGCDRPLETLKQAPTAKFCSQCGFPAQLPENKEIRGKRGIYQVKRFLGRQGNGRIYAAVQANSGQPVVIKEYLLPRRCFKQVEIRQQKKEIFERVVNFQVAETNPSDFRLIIPTEGISDRHQDRCYLIAPGNLAVLPNLKAYLLQQGRMEEEQVIKLLDQVLQSLEFLHSQKWKFTSGEIKQVLVHGNLSLDTLLISQTEVGFLVYLWDLSFWEDLFDPTLEEVSTKRVIDDLVALGNIGFYLLAAKEVTAQASYPLDPRNDLNWRGISPQLKNFLLRLLGLNSRFEDAATARRELRQLTLNLADSESIPVTLLDTSTSAEKTFSWLPWAIFSAIILLLGWGIWRLIDNQPNGKSSKKVSGYSCIKDIRNVPSGNFTYGIVSSEKPKDIAAKKLKDIFNINDTYKNAYKNFCSIDSDSSTFTQILNQIHQIDLKPFLANNQQNLIHNIAPRKIDFALLHLAPNKYQTKKIMRNAREEVINNVIAYDGLLVYVPFVDCKNCQQLGKYLEQKITLKQLRKIYTAKVDYWNEINPNIPSNIKIQAFVPDDNSALKLFEQLLFEDQRDIVAFQEAIASGKIKRQESYSILQEIRKLWQQGSIADGTKQGGIGFDFQEIAYKQCNVYPLAVVRDSQEFFPMLIQKANQQGVELFKDLSCQDKQNYKLNETVLRDRRYPLAFSLNLLYLNDDRYQNLEFGGKITEIFKTEEFQCHLSHKKLIPLELSEQDCKR
ncbi:MAG: substrate-binding domain-containing protein [Xenococcaceae cyanobacterium MO_188.B29]|nr:substrate-binding domain-containing protein [Xenococcaceae cyanobacterium MO_188.B29]